MKKLIILFLLLSCVYIGYGQKCVLDIQQVALKDTFLVKSINNVIKSNLDNSKSKNFYLTLYISEYAKGDTLFKYSILLNGYNIKKIDMDNVYPPFYTYLNGKIVLIYIKSVTSGFDFVYSNSSKRKLRKEIHRELKSCDKNIIVIRGKHLMEDYLYGGAVNVYIFRNHSPVIIYSPE